MAPWTLQALRSLPARLDALRAEGATDCLLIGAVDAPGSRVLLVGATPIAAGGGAAAAGALVVVLLLQFFGGGRVE